MPYQLFCNKCKIVPYWINIVRIGNQDSRFLKLVLYMPMYICAHAPAKRGWFKWWRWFKKKQKKTKNEEQERERRRAKTHKKSLSAGTQFQTSVILICAYNTHWKIYYRVEEAKGRTKICAMVVFEGTRMSLTTYYYEPSSKLELYRSFSILCVIERTHIYVIQGTRRWSTSS